MSPYAGSTFHHVPLVLGLFFPFRDSPAWLHQILFLGMHLVVILCDFLLISLVLDLLSALLLWLAVISYRRPRHDQNEGLVLKETKTADLSELNPAERPWPVPEYLPQLAALLYATH